MGDMFDVRTWTLVLQELSLQIGSYVYMLDERGQKITDAGKGNIFFELISHTPTYKLWQQSTIQFMPRKVSLIQDIAGFTNIAWPLIVDQKSIAYCFVSCLLTDITQLRLVEDVDPRQYVGAFDLISREKLDGYVHLIELTDRIVFPLLLKQKLLEGRTEDYNLILNYLTEVASVLDHDTLLKKSMDFFVHQMHLANCSIQQGDVTYRHQNIGPLILIYQQVEARAGMECTKSHKALAVSDMSQDFLFENITYIGQLPQSIAAIPISSGFVFLYSDYSLREKMQVITQLIGKFDRAFDNAIKHHTTLDLALTDPLTKVYNRAYFTAYLHRELAEMPMSEKVRNVCVFDVDDFKKYNDVYGHAEGDRILIEITRAVKIGLVASDVFARYGGEEFVLFFSSDTLEHAYKKADRIRMDIEQGSGVTVSIGILSVIGVLFAPDDMLKAADEALYEAKNSGKNKVVQRVAQQDGGIYPVQK